jgi:hypothetical protein
MAQGFRVVQVSPSGQFNIVTAIAPVSHGFQLVAGFVVISVTDILHMFRRSGTAPSNSLLKRVRPTDQEDWILFANPADHIHVTVDDLLIMAEEVQRFEVDWDLLRRPSSHIGSTARYDWDGMYIAQIVRVHEQGVPASQADWLGEVQDWFVANSENGEVPDERTIRRRLTPIWKRLQGSS